MSILKIKNAYYCAYSDVMSGEFFIFFCLSQEKLELEIFKIQPKEVISHQNSVVEALNIHNITTIRSPWEFEKDFSLNKVNNQFKFSYLNIFKNQHHKLCLRAAGALISYLEYTQCGKLEHLKNMNIESQENNLNIDAMTIKNLELVKNINGEKENSLLHLINKCKTSIGSRLMNKWILNPISNQNILKKRYQAINSLKKDNLNEIIRDILSNIKDIDRILSKISFMKVTPKELLKLKSTISFIPEIKKYISDINNIYLNNVNQDIFDQSNIFAMLSSTISEDVKVGIPYGNIIKKKYNKELDSLKKVYENQNFNILNIEKSERKKNNINSLKIKFNKIQGFYIEVSKQKSSLVPSNYIKKQTLKNTDRFTTIELSMLELEILKQKEKIVILEKYIYRNIVNVLKENIKKIQRTMKSIAHIDVISTLCERSEYFNWVEPVLVNKKCIKIKKCYHPVVLNATTKNFVLNDIFFDSSQKLFVITGPNMGGKSTYMRQLALIVILSHIGSFVPAQKAMIGRIDGIFTRIGSSDNISLNQSTFMTEMLETSYITKHATSNSLILLDEIGRGTSMFDGLSIAWATALSLYQKGSYVMFATHYFEMTKLKKILKCCENLYTNARIHNNEISLMHKIKKGSIDQSYGIHIAKLAGIDKDILKLANIKLNSLKNRYKKKKLQNISLLKLIFNTLKNEKNNINYLLTLYKIKNLIRSIIYGI